MSVGNSSEKPTTVNNKSMNYAYACHFQTPILTRGSFTTKQRSSLHFRVNKRKHCGLKEHPYTFRSFCRGIPVIVNQAIVG